MKQRYICCAYIATNSKIYDILQKFRGVFVLTHKVFLTTAKPYPLTFGKWPYSNGY